MRALQGTIVSIDLFYDADAARPDVTPRALAVEMEAAALFTVGAAAAVQSAACWPSPTRSTRTARAAYRRRGAAGAAEAMGAVAIAALAG